MAFNRNSHTQRIPGDREDGRSSFVHRAIVTSGKLAVVSPLYFFPFFLVLFYVTGKVWSSATNYIFIFSVVILGVDWLTLGYLPVKKRSWGPVSPPLLGLTIVRVIIRLAVGITISLSVRLWLITVIDTAISLIVFYATWIEPFRIDVTTISLHIPADALAQPLRIMHISDIHYEGLSPREAQLLKIVESESPDLIVITGDFLNLSSVFDTTAQSGVINLLSQISAPLGLYAITGSPAVDHHGIIPEIFQGLPIDWLQDEVICLNHLGYNLCVIGIVNTYNENRDVNALKQISQSVPKNSLSLLLYHTPDIMPTAVELGINLFFCGHTHGGQISLPVYGALFTSSKYGKKYEKGLFHEVSTILYVSRGLGMEGMGAPRARLFARPEVIMWELTPDTSLSLTDGPSIV